MKDIDPKTGIPKYQLAWLKTECVHFCGMVTSCRVGLDSTRLAALGESCVKGTAKSCEKYQPRTAAEYEEEVETLASHHKAMTERLRSK